jgi:phasin
MAKDGMPSFEIPVEMRTLAEKSVEQAKQAFDGFIAATKHAVSTAENHATSARTGVKEISEMAVGFTQRNVASSFDYAQKLVRAKDPSELMALHAEYVKSQIAMLTEQAKALNQQAAKFVGQSGEH